MLLKRQMTNVPLRSKLDESRPINTFSLEAQREYSSFLFSSSLLLDLDATTLLPLSPGWWSSPPSIIEREWTCPASLTYWVQLTYSTSPTSLKTFFNGKSVVIKTTCFGSGCKRLSYLRWRMGLTSNRSFMALEKRYTLGFGGRCCCRNDDGDTKSEIDV